MALTISFLIIFSCIMLAMNYKNKYSLLFVLMGLSIALLAITLIMEIKRISNYGTAGNYFFSGIDTSLFLLLNKLLLPPLNTVLLLKNMGFVLFQTANLAFIYLSGKYRKHSISGWDRPKRFIVILLGGCNLLYFIFYHPAVGYRIFLAQYRWEPLAGKVLLSVALGVLILLTVFTYLCPLVPVYYLLSDYRKGRLTCFSEQLSGLVLSLLAMDLLFFLFITEPPLVKWRGLLQTGFWRGLNEELVPKYDLGILPLISFCMLLAAFFLIRFQTMNLMEYFKEYSIKKNLRILHDNMRDVLHSEKNVIFNMKILAEAVNNDYGTPLGKQKLEKLVSMSSAHLESLTQSINNIKEAKIKTIRRDFTEAVDAALKAYQLPREIKLVKNFHCEKVICNYDLYHMTHVIINLLENAADSLKNQENARIELSLDVSDYWVLFSVSDNGSGIPPELINKIHKPYYSTKSKQNNWGIGLSYVQRVIKAHFGHMRIQSKKGDWTKVELLLMCA